MIKFINKLINFIFKTLYLFTLLLSLLLWTLIYPLLRLRHKRIGMFSSFPSYVLWIWYNNIHRFYERFIF